MSLSQQINDQYSKRGAKAHLYQHTDYTKYSQEEIRNTANELLHNYFKGIKDLSLLEIGAGNGTNAYLFEKIGLQLKNIAFNELLKVRIESIKHNFPNNKLYAGDALVLEFDQKFDIVFQSTVFTSILNDKDRKLLANKMWGLLKPGGIILWYDFIYNNPKNPDVKKVSIGEVNKLFEQAKRSVVRKITLAPPIGRRVGKFYKLFNLPILRSHILAVYQKGND